MKTDSKTKMSSRELASLFNKPENEIIYKCARLDTSYFKTNKPRIEKGRYKDQFGEIHTEFFLEKNQTIHLTTENYPDLYVSLMVRWREIAEENKQAEQAHLEQLHQYAEGDTMSSREIADLTGKLHKNVLADCDKLSEHYTNMGMAEISAVNYKADNGQFYREYHLTRMQTFDLMTGYDTELRIKVNRRWEQLEKREAKKEIDFSNPQTILELAQNWADEQKRRKEAEDKVKQLAPKAELMDKVLDSDEKIDIGQTAKILELPFGRNTMFKKLREKGIFFKNRNEPKQEYIKRGYFVLKEKFIERTNHEGFVVVKVLVTQKGLGFLSNTFQSHPVSRNMAKIT